MAFETADEIAAYFDPDMGAESASCTPAAGVATACTVVLDQPIEVTGVGLAGASLANTRVLVRLSEIADPRGGAFTGIASLGAALVYTVAEADLDVAGVIWTCHLRPNT